MALQQQTHDLKNLFLKHRNASATDVQRLQALLSEAAKTILTISTRYEHSVRRIQALEDELAQVFEYIWVSHSSHQAQTDQVEALETSTTFSQRAQEEIASRDTRISELENR